MVIIAEASIETVAENDQAKYVFVFTEAFTQRHGTAYTLFSPFYNIQG